MIYRCAGFIGLTWFLVSIESLADSRYYPSNPNPGEDAVFVAHQGVVRFEHQQSQPSWSAIPGIAADAPVVTLAVVLVGSSAGLAALDRDTGALLWRLSSKARIFSPSASDEFAYAGSEDGMLRAMRINSGEVIWQRQFKGWIYAPAIFEHLLIAGGQEQRLYAVNRSDGRLVWQIRLSQELVFRPVAVNDSHVVVTTFSGEVLALDVESGGVLWRVKDDVANLSPAVLGDRLFFRTFSGALKARSAHNGRLLWKSDRQLSSHSIQVVDGYLIARNDSGDVLVIDTGDGSTVVQHRVQVQGAPIGKPVMLADRLVLFTDSRGLQDWPKLNTIAIE